MTTPPNDDTGATSPDDDVVYEVVVPFAPVRRTSPGLAPVPAPDPSIVATSTRSRLPRWLVPLAIVVAVAAVAAVVLVPLLTRAGPWDSLGDEGSPGREVAKALSERMACEAGEISDDRSVLACYRADGDEHTMVFLQADHDGRVAAYTVEIGTGGHSHDHGDGTAHDDDEVFEIANEVASIVTPGSSFAECSHNRTEEFFCFGPLTAWRSDAVQPVQSTGEKKRLPALSKTGDALAEDGWQCTLGMCTKGDQSITVRESFTGQVIQYSPGVDLAVVQQTAGVLLDGVEGVDELTGWADSIDGSLFIEVADRFVVGYLPQPAGAGLFVIDEIAGVLIDEA